MKSDLLLHSQDGRAEAAILLDCTTEAIKFHPDTFESSWKTWIWLKHDQNAHSSRRMKNVPINQRIYCGGSSPLFTREPLQTAHHTPRLPKRLMNLSQNLPLGAFTFPQLTQLSIQVLACSDFKGLERSPPVLAVLCVEFPGLHPVSVGFPSQPPSLQAQPRKALSSPPTSAWQGARLRIYVLLKQH